MSRSDVGMKMIGLAVALTMSCNGSGEKWNLAWQVIVLI